MKNKPVYSVESVDHALKLAQLLQQEGPMRVTDAAEQLGVSRSTAHRLLAMLVYREFAEQTEDRRYRAGSMLRPAETAQLPVVEFRRICLPHLHALMERVGESTNVTVRVGTEVRFVAMVECSQLLRVGDRVGSVQPAWLASGGKAMLATLPVDEVHELFVDSIDAGDFSRLRRQLALVRRSGFAINNQQTEKGLTAIGMALRDSSGRASAAVSIAMPSVRFDRERLPLWVGALSNTVAEIDRDLELMKRQLWTHSPFRTPE